MKLQKKNIVITGGTTGIGFALSKALLNLDNNVLVIDYCKDNIAKALENEPRLKAIKADLSDPSERVQLVEQLEKQYPDYNILINNAGIQRWVNLQNAKKEWSFYHNELAINFEAPMHLSLLALDHLIQQPEAAIINVTSGLVITPGAWVPFYTSAKSGLHGFTESLRLQLQDTNTKVYEIMPPAVNTSLGGSKEHSYGISLEDFIPAVIKQIEKEEFHITYDTSTVQLKASKEQNKQQTQMNWEHFKTNPTFLNA